MGAQAPSYEVIAQGPTFASENQIGLFKPSAVHSLGKTDYFEGNLLFSGAVHLLPLKGDEDTVLALFRDGIDLMSAAPGAAADQALDAIVVPTQAQRWNDHGLQDAAGAGVAHAHDIMLKRDPLRDATIELFEDGAMLNTLQIYDAGKPSAIHFTDCFFDRRA